MRLKEKIRNDKTLGRLGAWRRALACLAIGFLVLSYWFTVVSVVGWAVCLIIRSALWEYVVNRHDDIWADHIDS